MRRTTEARQTRCKDPTKEVVCSRFSKCKEPSSPTRLQMAACGAANSAQICDLKFQSELFAMPNLKWVTISFLVLGVGSVACAVDDSVAPEGKGGAAGRAGSSGTPTTSTGGRAGSFGVAGSGVAGS